MFLLPNTRDCALREVALTWLRKSILIEKPPLEGRKRTLETWGNESYNTGFYFSFAQKLSGFFSSWTVGRVGVTSNTSMWQISAYKILTCYISLTIWDLIMLPVEIQVQVLQDLFTVCPIEFYSMFAYTNQRVHLTFAICMASSSCIEPKF